MAHTFSQDFGADYERSVEKIKRTASGQAISRHDSVPLRLFQALLRLARFDN